MPVSSRAASSTADQRGPRHKVFLPAELRDVHGATRVHLLNLSTTGALLHGEATPNPGTMIQLTCGDTTWLARVVWVQQKRFGVVHIAPFGPKAIAALVGA